MEKEKESNTEIINSQRVVDRLDFQLLITVIFFFISAWAFLNNKICNFTDSELATVQMDYILVHYILSLFLIYSIVLAAYKSYFIKNDQYVVKDYVQLMFNFYLDTWIWILLICIIIIVFAGVFDYDWFLWFIFFSFYVALKICDNYPLQKSEKVDIFHIKILSCVIPTLIIGFILFLSSMTSIINIVSIKTDKPFYSFSDKVYITVDARGYACRHKLVGLS